MRVNRQRQQYDEVIEAVRRLKLDCYLASGRFWVRRRSQSSVFVNENALKTITSKLKKMSTTKITNKVRKKIEK